MVRAKNYETMATFVKVMHKKLWPLFSRTRCLTLLPPPLDWRHGVGSPCYTTVCTRHNFRAL